MKNLIFALLVFASLTVSAGVKLVGSINVISVRNIDSKTEYVLLKTGANASQKELRKNQATSIDQAVNNIVSQVPGGEFLKNVNIYSDGDKWAISGDVWGVAESANVLGFRIGDNVLIKNSSLNPLSKEKEKFSKGVIIAFKDKKSCLVKRESGEIKEVNYNDLSKSESN